MERVFLRDHWKTIISFLEDEDVINAIDAGMYRLTRCDVLKYFKNTPDSTTYVGAIWKRDGIVLPYQMGNYHEWESWEPTSIEAYKPIRKCHFIAPFCKKIGEKLFPNETWARIHGSHHSLTVSVVRKTRDDYWQGHLIKDNSNETWKIVRVIDIINEDVHEMGVHDLVDFSTRGERYTLCFHDPSSKREKMEMEVEIAVGGSERTYQ